ncbi:MAG: cupin domain-containing protein [Spirochaetota bacterium]
MIRKAAQMKIKYQEQMRGGTGTATLQQVVEPDELNHARLFSHVTLPAGASVGSHQHIKETEYFYIISGQGTVEEDSGEHSVEAGDVVITGDQMTHSIRNAGKEPLEFLAVIILDD